MGGEDRGCYGPRAGGSEAGLSGTLHVTSVKGCLAPACSVESQRKGRQGGVNRTLSDLGEGACSQNEVVQVNTQPVCLGSSSDGFG